MNAGKTVDEGRAAVAARAAVVVVVVDIDEVTAG